MIKRVARKYRSRRDEIVSQMKRLQADLDEADGEIAKLEASCTHDWEEPEQKSKHTPGYHIPADKRGSDFRPSCDVPAKTETWYIRTCKRCGKTEKSVGMKPASTLLVPLFQPTL